MSFQFSFPFCGISDLGTPTQITGTVVVGNTNYGVFVSTDVNTKSLTWQDNKPTQEIVLELNDELFTGNQLYFTITAHINTPDCLFLFSQPKLIPNQSVHYEIVLLYQKITTTDFTHSNGWINAPVKSKDVLEAKFKIVIHETVDNVVDFLADSVTYRAELTYIERTQNKPALTAEENIEYYLGKDNFKNLFFDGHIPAIWEIPSRTKNFLAKQLSSITIKQPDGIAYQYNNLGYRSSIDYTVDSLTDKKIILCLGDSDLFGAGLEYKDLWATKLQTLLPDYTILNMGIRGASADAITRVGVNTIMALGDSVKGVLVHWPHTSLREFVSKTYKGGVHTHRNYDLPYDDWWKHIDWQSNNYNYHKNRLLLESVCSKHNIDFHDLNINRDDSKVPYDFIEFGIYSCIGPRTQQAVASYFYKKLNDQPSLFQTQS
jgi:hypothetical protein